MLKIAKFAISTLIHHYHQDCLDNYLTINGKIWKHLLGLLGLVCLVLIFYLVLQDIHRPAMYKAMAPMPKFGLIFEGENVLRAITFLVIKGLEP